MCLLAHDPQAFHTPDAEPTEWEMPEGGIANSQPIQVVLEEEVEAGAKDWTVVESSLIDPSTDLIISYFPFIIGEKYYLHIGF